MKDKDKDKDKILIFGGTTEGRELAGVLRKNGIPHTVSVATEYGARIEYDDRESDVTVGRKSKDEMVKLMIDGGYTAVVDATHPYAVLVSSEIKAACAEASLEYIRLLRDCGKNEKTAGKDNGAYVYDTDVIYVDSVEEASDVLEQKPGNILLLTGSKDLKKITENISDRSRVYVRILPDEKGLMLCREAGINGRQIIAMQGPFSEQMNRATIREYDISVILTKDSGHNGGFEEKISAAINEGIKAVVIRNPESINDHPEGLSMTEVIKKLEALTGVTIPECKKSIVIAGIGPGDKRYHTDELDERLRQADIVFGAATVVKRLEGIKVPVITEYAPEKIYDHLNSDDRYVRPVAVYSGDISLCSGAYTAADFFKEKGYEVECIPGISSVTLLAARTGIKLQDATVVTTHGKSCNVTGHARINEHLIVIPSDVADAKRICEDLKRVFADNLVGLKAIAGYELGTKDEKIFDPLAVGDIWTGLVGKILLYVNNPGTNDRPVITALKDDDLIRGRTPMTKEEIRALSVRKLGLTKRSVLYDIGAGTGSISVEAALLHPDIEVYSIEKDEDAVGLLEQNKAKYALDNMHIIKGEAPEALKGLPAPTHVFIGGSGQRLKEILDRIDEVNDEVRIVINCVTIETFTLITQLAKEYDQGSLDIIQINVSRYKKVGEYHMADSVNPVYVISFTKGQRA